MSSQYVQLRREVVANPNTQPGEPAFVATIIFWDTLARTYYPVQEPSQALDPAELAVGTQVQRVTLTVGSTTKDRIFYYRGNGQVATRSAPATGTGGGFVCTLAPPAVSPNPGRTSIAGAFDAAIDVTAVLGAPPYQITLTGPAGQVETKTALNAIYPVRFYHRRSGSYVASIVDKLGCINSLAFQVNDGSNGVPYGSTLEESYNGDADTGSGSKTIWNPDTLQVEPYSYNGGGTDGYYYQNPSGNVVDGFYVPGTSIYRTVYADGNGSIYFRDSDAGSTDNRLDLDNLIEFPPTTAAAQDGGVIVEVNATAQPVTFTCLGQTNQTGRFDGLAVGHGEVLCTDLAGNTLTVPYLLEQPLALWGYLDFSQTDSVPLRVELWLKEYTGEPNQLTGQASPVVLDSDGLNTSLGGQGDLPSVVGTSCDVALLVAPLAMQELLLGDDRTFRVDYYRNRALRFRGFGQPDVYDQELQSGLLPLTLTAADGLASLKEIDMLGHLGQRLGTRRSWLHTLLHCLSRCTISLPVHLYVNRRSTEMDDTDAPELAANTDRTGYWDTSKNEPVAMRTVLDAVCQALGGTLVQRGGCWEVRSPLEALDDAPGRAYLPAGTAVGALVAPAPTNTIEPLALAPGCGWVKAEQRQQIRPGWKSLTGTTDAGWFKNAFVAGNVFSDHYAWLDDQSRLKPLNGWRAATSRSFPLVLELGGEKGTDYTTRWLRSSTPSIDDSNYLESPLLPLVAVPESCQAILTISGRFIPAHYLGEGQQFPATAVLPATLDTATEATVLYEVVIDGQRPAQPSSAPFKLVANNAKDSTVTLELAPLPAGSTSAVLRLHSWTASDTNVLLEAVVFDPTKNITPTSTPIVKYDFGTGVYRTFQPLYYMVPPFVFTPTGLPTDPYWQEIESAVSTGRLQISSVAIELRPQQATWDSEDNFRADGPAGTVRPTEPLEVYHPDAPIAAGLFEGNRYAFKKAVALEDGSLSTAWARALDKQPSPLFESNIYDALALRDGPARLLTGTLSYREGEPIQLLDTLDTPYDVPGRRFLVAAVETDEKLCRAEVSLVEIGPGTAAPDPLDSLPDGVRIISESYAYAPGKYTPYPRLTSDGSYRTTG